VNDTKNKNSSWRENYLSDSESIRKMEGLGSHNKPGK
jgi:hypothetical protein